jgi:uncharacterized protein YjbK
MARKKNFGKPPCIFKINISQEEYELLLKDFRNPVFKEMSYYYFDTDLNPEKAEFLNANVRLRLRTKKGRYTLELKDKSVCPSKDFSQELSPMRLRHIFRGETPNGLIRHRLLELGLSDQILWLSCTRTIRVKRNFYDGVLVLDKTVHVCQTHYLMKFRSYQSLSKNRILLLKRELKVNSGHNYFTSKLKHVWSSKI